MGSISQKACQFTTTPGQTEPAPECPLWVKSCHPRQKTNGWFGVMTNVRFAPIADVQKHRKTHGAYSAQTLKTVLCKNGIDIILVKPVNLGNLLVGKCSDSFELLNSVAVSSQLSRPSSKCSNLRTGWRWSHIHKLLNMGPAILHPQGQSASVWAGSPIDVREASLLNFRRRQINGNFEIRPS